MAVDMYRGLALPVVTGRDGCVRRMIALYALASDQPEEDTQ